MAKGRGRIRARGSSLLVEHLFCKRSNNELQRPTLLVALLPSH